MVCLRMSPCTCPQISKWDVELCSTSGLENITNERDAALLGIFVLCEL